jgi:hypothetical protein
MPELRRVSPGKRGLHDAVRALAAEQDGIVRRTQLLARGIDRRTIDRTLRSGTLHRLHPGIYSVIAPELLSEDALLLNALFAAGPGAFLSHGTAAWRWRIIPAPPTKIEVALPRRERLHPGDVVQNGRFRSTSVPRTLLDLAARYTQPALRRALAEAEFEHDIRPDDITRVLRRGHPGSAAPSSRPRCPRPGSRPGKEHPRKAVPGPADPPRDRAARAQPAARPVHRRLHLAHTAGRRRARRPPARPPAPGRRRRRPRPVAAPPPVRAPPLRHQAGRRPARRRARRPARRVRPGGRPGLGGESVPCRSASSG